MVRFVPRPIYENVNVSQKSPLHELLIYAGVLVGVLVGVYFVLGLALNILIDRMPARVESVAGQLFQSHKLNTPEQFQEARDAMQQLVDDLAGHMPDSALSYTVDIIEDENVNVFALPGGRILVLSGLVEEIQSENELAMILGHELGHFVHRDHLRAMGRGLVFIVLSSIFFGTDSGVTDLVSGALSAIDLKFSRSQESSADQFGLKLVHAHYGHITGATDFFERIQEKINVPKFLHFAMTHPLGKKRVMAIQDFVDLNRYSQGTKTPLHSAILGIFHSNGLSP